MEDSKAYRDKKAFYESLITLYGRNVALEVLQDGSVEVHKLHLSESNRPDGVIDAIVSLAERRGVEIEYHSKTKLSRISKNAKQDQGVALDVRSKNYLSASQIAQVLPAGYRLLALDGIHNPQNLGMIIRSAAAGNVDGIVLPKKNSAKLSPLVMKASAGTLFKIRIFYCDDLEKALEGLNAEVYALSSHASEDIYSLRPEKRSVFVLGNESEGVSKEVERRCSASLRIPMNRGVESLNVAVTAALISFMRS